MIRIIAIATSLLLLTSCGASSQGGKASWYGGKFHGRLTASGERFNENSMTAAHRSLPFGTLVSVTNKTNGKSVVVRINDRGPYHKKRVIDLSKAAAAKIGMIRAGVVPVEIKIVKKTSMARVRRL